MDKWKAAPELGETSLAPKQPRSARNAVASIRSLNTFEIKRWFTSAGWTIRVVSARFFFEGTH